MLSATGVKSGSEKKKSEQEHVSLSSIKRLVVQNNGKEMYKKLVLRVQTSFFSN